MSVLRCDIKTLLSVSSFLSEGVNIFCVFFKDQFIVSLNLSLHRWMDGWMLLNDTFRPFGVLLIGSLHSVVSICAFVWLCVHSCVFLLREYLSMYVQVLWV